MTRDAPQTALDRDGNLVGRNGFAPRPSRCFKISRLRSSPADARPPIWSNSPFRTDMDNLPRYREARDRFFASVTPSAAPAVTLVEVSKMYGPDFLIEIEANAAAWPATAR
jgi:hypothetical protein